MPLDASLKNKIQQWLLNQHVQVPDDWMEACLEWLQNENQVICRLIAKHESVNSLLILDNQAMVLPDFNL